MRLRSLAVVFVVFACNVPVSAAFIPYLSLEELARQSTDIVLCDEVACETKKGKPSGDYVPTYYEFKLRVVRAVKGERKPGEELTVELSSLYSRQHMDTWAVQPRPAPVPLGRGLFFLNRTDGVWHPATGGVKLFINGEVYCYGQFVGNPGGLWLARMAPENITIPTTEAYDEGFLLVDLGAALERAKKPRTGDSNRFWSHEDAIRRDYQPTPQPAEQPDSAPADSPGWQFPTFPPTTNPSGWWIAALGIGLPFLIVVLINLPRKRRRSVGGHDSDSSP